MNLGVARLFAMVLPLAAGGVLAAGGLPSAAQGAATIVAAPTFTVDPAWPTIPNNWILGDVSSVAVDSRDHVWVLHRPRAVPEERRANAAPPVLEFDASGRLVGSWGGPGAGYEWPEREHGIYVDPNGFVWIGGNNNYGTPPSPGSSDDMLLKFTTAGAFVMQIGHRAASRGNADTGNVRQAADAFLSGNELFVADGYGNQRLIVFDSATGAFKRMWGAFGNPQPGSDAGVPASVKPEGPLQFGLVHSVKVSHDGLVYVADRNNKRVQVFTVAGAYRTQVGVGAAAQGAAGLALSPDPEQRLLFVANQGEGQVVILDRQTLRVVGTFGRPGPNPGEFGTLHHLAIDSKGNIYTAEIGRNRRAQKFVAH